MLAWRHGLAINPESISLRNQIAQLAFVQHGDVNGAIAFLRAGLQRPLFPFPRSKLLQMEIAFTQRRAGEKSATRATLVQLLRENPDCHPAIAWLLSMKKS